MARRMQPPDHGKKKAASSWSWQEEGILLIMAGSRQPPDYGKEKANSRLWKGEGKFLIVARSRQPPDYGKKKAPSLSWQGEASSWSWQEEGILLIMARRRQPPDYDKKKASPWSWQGEASFLSSLNGVADTPTRARQEERGRGRWRRAPGTGILHLAEQRLKQANLYIKRGLLGKMHKVIRMC
jgi:hypothetical protein